MGDRDVSDPASDTSDGEESEVSESSDEFDPEEYREERRAAFEAGQKVAYERALKRKNAKRKEEEEEESVSSSSSDDSDGSAGISGTANSSVTTKDGTGGSSSSSPVEGKLLWVEAMQKKGANIPQELFIRSMEKPKKVSAGKQPEEPVVQSQATPELNFVASSPEENDTPPPDHFLTSTPFVGHWPSSQAEVSFSPVVHSSKKNNLIFTSKKAIARVPARSQDDSKQNSQPVKAGTSKSNRDGTFNVSFTDAFKGKALRRSDAPNQKENEQPSVPAPSLPGPSRTSAVQPSTSKKSHPRQTVPSDSEDEVRDSDTSGSDTEEVPKKKGTFNVSNAFKGNALRRTNIEVEKSVFAKTRSPEKPEDEADNPPEVEGQEAKRKSTLNVSNPFKGKTLRRTNLEEEKSVFAKTRTSSETSESSSEEEVESIPEDDRKGVKSKSTINVSNPFKGKGGLRHSNVPSKDKPKTSMSMASDVPTPRSRTSVGNKKPERSSKRNSTATGRRDSSLSTPFHASFNVSRMSQKPVRIGPSNQKQLGDSLYAKLADLSGDENEVEEEAVPVPVRNLSESFGVLESSLVEEEPAAIVPPVPKPRKRNMTMVTQTNENEPEQTSEKIVSAAGPVDIASVPEPSVVNEDEVNASPVADTRRATRARGERNDAEAPKQKGTVEVVEKQSKKMQKQPATKLPKRNKRGPTAEDNLQDAAPVAVQDYASPVVDNFEENPTPIVDNAEVNASPVAATRRATRARVEKDRVESSKQKEAVEVTKQSSKKLQKQPALKLPKRNKRGPTAEDNFQEDAAPVVVQENAAPVVDNFEENPTPIVDNAEVNASPVAATRRATRARVEKDRVESSKQKEAVKVTKKSSKQLPKQPGLQLPKRNKRGTTAEADLQEDAAPVDVQENASQVVDDLEENPTPIVDNAEVNASPVAATRRATRARVEKDRVESSKQKEAVKVTKKPSKQLPKQPALKLPKRNKRGTTAEADLQEDAAPVDVQENASQVVDDLEENPTPIVDEAEVNASPVAATRPAKRARGEKDGAEPQKQKEAVVKKSSKKLQKQPSTKLSKRGLPAEEDVDANASPPDEGTGTEVILSDDEPGPSTSLTQKRKQSAMTAADDNSKVSKRLRISAIEERLAVPGSKKPSSQTSMSSTRPATYSKRPSIFSKGPSGSKKKVAGRKNPNPPERYVGNDVFGNYHMLDHKDFKEMMASIHPDLKLSREVMEGIELKLNHFLEDFFTHHCNQSRLPYGVISFQDLKTAFIDQCLIDEDVSDNGFIKVMKRHMSKEDFKNCEGMVYPKPGATDTIDFVYQ